MLKRNVLLMSFIAGVVAVSGCSKEPEATVDETTVETAGQNVAESAEEAAATAGEALTEGASVVANEASEAASAGASAVSEGVNDDTAHDEGAAHEHDHDIHEDPTAVVADVEQQY